MSIERIGLLGNPQLPDIASAASFIRTFCQKQSVEVLQTRTLARLVGETGSGLPASELVRRSDVVMALGGDGTMLRAARVIGTVGTPLLGVNLGSLGYLTDVRFEEVAQALTQLFSGDYHLEQRARVACTVWRAGQRVGHLTALNDAVVNMGGIPRALEMELRLDGESLGRFLGDGMILSTPTGSTAYNLSAGGSICHSAVPCLLLTPICPHSLGMRPLIVSDSSMIELILHNTGQGASITADGHETQALRSGDRLEFGVAEVGVTLVKFPQSNFYRVMRHKLNWGAPRRRQEGI